jgi:predicted transcriptional regulator
MSGRLYPYVIFLPRDRKMRVLEAVFGSEVPVEILRFAIRRGIHEKIYQKELISSLNYSNKTIIDHLKALTELTILDEHVEKSESLGRTVWVKYYTLTDLGRWFALLLVEEESLSNEEKREIIVSAFRSYTRWVIELSERLGVGREELSRIFDEEAGRP